MSTTLLPHNYLTLSDGGKLRYAQFEPPGRPIGTVLVVPGRREFIEKKYAELGEPILGMGYRLIIVELRNQGLSSRLLSGDLFQRDHIDNFNTHLDDLRAFYTSVISPNLIEPLLMHGHSMGGHLTLRLLAEKNAPPACAVFITAPMLALTGVPAHLSAYAASWASVRLFGHASDYAPTQHDYSAEDCEFSSNPLTKDAERFRIIENYFRQYPEMRVGGVTWGWLLAALRSMQKTHSPSYLVNIKIPVLALIGGEDSVTPANENAHYLNIIPSVQTHIIPASRHDILNETEIPRQAAWVKIRTFLSLIKKA